MNTTNAPYENEQRKREFFEHLRGAQGFAESSVKTFAEAIGQYQIFSHNDDFANFNQSEALKFRDWLNGREAKTVSKKLSIVSQYNYLRRVKKFFKWLSEQPHYRNKILKSDVEFLRLSKKDAAIARSGTTRTMPSLEEVRLLIEGIGAHTEIDMRDRALISFALITGMRISAITSLRIKNFDYERKMIDQNPGDGVKTKNSKRILTTFFPIGWDSPELFFMEWYKYLKDKGFNSEDPIFPSTLGGFAHSQNSYSKSQIGNTFWCDSGGARKIFEKRCKNVELPYFNPHSLRHLVVNIMSKKRLTEEEKRAISLNLGHANVGTTFGSYGYGSMSEEDAVDIVKQLKVHMDNNQGSNAVTEDEKIILEKMLKRFS